MAAIALLRAVLPLLLLSGCGLQPVLSMAQATPPAQAAQDAETPSSAEEPLAEARRQLRLNAFVEAEATVRHALVTAPNSADAQFLLGYILFREIQSHAADAEELVDPGRQKGFIDLRSRNARASLAEYTEGARLHVPSAFDLKIVALDYILLGDYPDADKWMTKALDGDPSDEQGWYYEGRIQFKQGEYARSLEAFGHALRLDPHDSKAEDNLGLAYEGLGQTKEAIAAYQKATELARAAAETEDSPWVDLGSLLTAQGRAQEAVPYLMEAVHISPNDLRAYEKLAEAYRTLERWPEVQAALERAVALSPDSASLHFMLGQAYRKNGAPEKAKIEAQRTAALKAQESSSEQP